MVAGRRSRGCEIRDVKALKGKRVGVSGIGSGPDSLLREILRQNGLDANRDVTVLSLGVMPMIFSGLQSGIVDAAMLSPPVTFKAEEAGFRELVSFPKQDLVELQGSILVRDASLQSDPHRWKDSSEARTRAFSTSKTIAAVRFP